MALGIIELLLLAALVVLIVRGAGNGHLLYWLATGAAIFLVVGLALAVVRSYEIRGVEQHRAQIDYDALADDLAERRARGEVIPDMYGELTHGPQTEAVASHSRVKVSGLILIVLLPLAAFAAMRAHRRGGAAPWLAAGGALTGLLMIGLIGVRSSHESTATVVYEQLPQIDAATPAPAEPIGELWDRLNQPQIELEADAVAAHEAVAATLVAEVNGEATESAEIATNTAEDDEAASAAHAHDAAEEDHGASVATESDVAESASTDPAVVASEDHAAAAVTTADVASHEHDAPVAEETAPPRPDWVGTPRVFVNNVWRVPIEAGPYATLHECHAALEMEMRAVVETRIRELVSERLGWSASTPSLESMGLGTTFIYRELLADQYVESGEASFGPTKTAWALLEFDPADDRRLLDAWQSYARWDGIMITLACSLAVLGVLALAFGLIKVDTWTRGYYSKRLFLGVPAAIIAIVMLLGSL